MKKFTKLAMGLLLLAVMIFANTGTVFAEGTTTIYLSTNDSIGVGDNISITIKASDSAPIKVLYTDSILGFVSCSNDSYSASGNSITFTGKEATIKFSGAAEGKANVIVSSEVLTGSSAQITVTGSGNSTQEATPAEDAQEKKPQEQTTEETTEISGEAISVSGGAVGPITVGTPDSLISSSLMETTLVLEDGTNVPAYRLQNSDSSFYYFYGSDANGESSWYSYDAAHGTLQQADTSIFAAGVINDDNTRSDTDLNDSSEDSSLFKTGVQKLYNIRRLLVVILFICLIGLIILFNIHMKKRDEEFDDEFFEEYGEAQAKLDEIENNKNCRKEKESDTISKRKNSLKQDEDNDIPIDLSSALEETVYKTEKEAETHLAGEKKESGRMNATQNETTENDGIDLSEAIVNQVLKPSQENDDELHIIDFNDL